jgi:hypothetical protein
VSCASHEHIAVVGETVSNEFQRFLKQNAAITKLAGANKDGEAETEESQLEQLKAMSKIGASLPAFEEQRKRVCTLGSFFDQSILSWITDWIPISVVSAFSPQSHNLTCTLMMFFF